MKSIDIKKIGTVAIGATMIGATLATPVLAGMDTMGIEKGFFYDANYVPKVQIVVGEKANAGGPDDFVTAGNIAATIGNLAYMEETATVGGADAAATGKVLIETSALGAVGEYVQDTEGVKISEDFYSQSGAEGNYIFDGGEKTYESGGFTQYSITCEKEQLAEATILQTLTSNNIHCLFCHNLCLEALENPSHDMEEKLYVNNDNIWYYESGIGKSDPEYLEMAIKKNAIKYILEAGWIPMERLTSGGTDSDHWVDFEYRGKMLFFGKEYYVKDIEGEDKIILAEGTRLDDITSEGYTSEYKGYKFKIDHLIYSGEYVVAGILLTIQKPDGTEVQRQISKMANAVVDDLEISGVYAESSGGVETASIIVYDISNQVVLEDGEELSIGGNTWEGWKVNVNTAHCISGSECAKDITQYSNLDSTNDLVLANVTVTLVKNVDESQSDPVFHALRVGDEFNLPGEFKLIFKGYMTSSFREAECSGAGEGNIVISEGEEPYQVVVSMTNDKHNRYDLRLDNGPFTESGDEDAFLIGGKMYQYLSSTKDDRGTTDKNDDIVKVKLKPVGSGSKQTITLYHMCNMTGGSTGDFTRCDPNLNGGNLQSCSCENIDEITLRTVALSDAFDDNCDGFSNDENITVSAEDIYWANVTVNGVNMIMLFNDDDDSIILSKKDPWNTNAQSQILLLVDPDVVSPDGKADALDDFENDGSELDLWVERELDLNNYALDSCIGTIANSNGTDKNNDKDPDDLLIYVSNEDGETVLIDMSDRDQGDTRDIDDDYEHSIGVYTTVCEPSNLCTFNATGDNTWNCTNVTFSGCTLVKGANYTSTKIMVMNDEEDSVLIVPEGGDTYTIDWGTDRKITSIEVCHPQRAVDATYFIGTEEKETVTYDEITDADVGKTITAGCCEFKVSNFTMEAGEGGEVTYTKVTVNPVGNLVVSEIGADETKNLIIVGGPAVNGMCTVTKEELETAPDKFIVRRDGNKIMVAGYLASDTKEAGDALIQWLKENIHA